MIIRLFNIFLAAVMILLFVIPFLFIFLLVKLTSQGPAIHWSKRIGIKNNIFLMPKFRSMKIDTPQLATDLMKDSRNYLTPIGSFLRKSSLDELPQLFSVLIGKMSFVGPRPALFNQYNLIELRTRANIHTIPPGITGWAQVNGRDNLSDEEKVALDMFYLEHRNLLLDLKIILKTALGVINRSNISH